MTLAHSEEHADCENWARWAKDDDPKLWYPKRWNVPDGERQETTEDAERPAYDLLRAHRTDGYLAGWLLRWKNRGCAISGWRYQVIYTAYYHGRKPGELEIREALRALKDEKELGTWALNLKQA